MDVINYSIEKVADEEETYNTILLLESEHHPAISAMVTDIKIYAEKLCRYGEVWILKNSELQRVGIIAAYMNDRNTHVAYVSLLLIAREYQGMKLGGKLLSCMENMAKEKGMERIKLEVMHDNEVGIKFYKSHGYEICGKKEDRFYMEKNTGGYRRRAGGGFEKCRTDLRDREQVRVGSGCYGDL